MTADEALRAIGLLKATVARIDLAEAPACQLANLPEMCASCKLQAVRADVLTDVVDMIDDADKYLRDLEQALVPPPTAALKAALTAPEDATLRTPEDTQAPEDEDYDRAFLAILDSVMPPVQVMKIATRPVDDLAKELPDCSSTAFPAAQAESIFSVQSAHN
ncbi:hypothetical protein T492DRAFT_1135864 [Pavlovales sp. CCMP2436]|nr:hypothetical protein T492DRAFT_1135864 [Pavlovales sp. CCMP2436]